MVVWKEKNGDGVRRGKLGPKGSSIIDYRVSYCMEKFNEWNGALRIIHAHVSLSSDAAINRQSGTSNPSSITARVEEHGPSLVNGPTKSLERNSRLDGACGFKGASKRIIQHGRLRDYREQPWLASLNQG